jgi:hypothetical protein
MIDAIQFLRIKDMGLDQWHANQPIRDANRKASLFRKKIVELAGGKCKRCKWKPKEACDYAAIDFHHREPGSKRFTLNTSALRRPWDQVEAEIAKCDLLCARCHRIEHYGRQGKPRNGPKAREGLAKPRSLEHLRTKYLAAGQPAKPIPFTSTSSEEAGIEDHVA